MKYKLGLKLWSINTDCYLDEAIKLYDKNIYDYIELYVVPDTLNQLEKWKKLKIPFIIHCPHFAHGFNLAKEEKKESNRKIFDEVQKYADTLNASYIIIHGGIDGNIEETAKQFASLNEPRALIENKPYVALPNKMGGNFCRGYNYDEIKIVKDAANCGFCLDFGHAICAANSLFTNNAPSPRGIGDNMQESSSAIIEKRLEYIYSYIETFLNPEPTMFHLTDVNDITSPYDSHPHLGSGQLDIKRIIKYIPKNSPITLETVKNSKDNLDDFVYDTIFVRKFFK